MSKTTGKEAAPERVFREKSRGAAELAFVTSQRIRTLDDVLRHGEVDPAIWRVKDYEITSWEVGLKVRKFEGKRVVGEDPRVLPLWRVNARLERLVPRPLEEGTAAFFERFAGHAPRYPKLELPAVADPHLLVVGLHDVHFGKLAWARETGQAYDVSLADRVYRNAVVDTLARTRHVEVDHFLLPVGSDLAHVDGMKNTTTAGTIVDTDSRAPKIIEAAEAATIWAVEAMAARAPVTVVWLPGNHDYIVSLGIARAVKAWFRHAGHVRVDVTPSPRKYFRYHRVLLGLSHGAAEKMRELPGLMALEAPDDWAATSCREWHRGHEHRRRQLDFLTSDTHGGVTVRTLPSLSATDAWHHQNGFVGAPRAADSYLYSSRTFAGCFPAEARWD